MISITRNSIPETRNTVSLLLRTGILTILTLFFSPLTHAFTQELSCAENSLRLGMSTALTGPAAHLGKNMRTGILAALNEANAKNGIAEKKLCLIALDDGYEPSRTVPNMHSLIKEKNVLALIGNVGTPTAIAAIPIANRLKTPFFGAFTGAGVLRKTPPDRYVINYRASYAEETAAMVQALIVNGGLKPEEIAFFSQRDAYGDAGFIGGITALKKHGLKNENAIVHGRYERNTLAVENGLADILLTDPLPRAVIMVAAYAPCALFIRLAEESGLKAHFLNVSFVGAVPLARELGADGDGVIVTQVVPHFSSDLPIAHDFRRAIHGNDPDATLTFGAFEGYIAARILLRALKQIPGPPDRETIIDSLERLGEFDIGLGAPLNLDSKEHQASHRVWPTIIRKGRVVPFQWKELPRLP
ncbi:MAG: ABC transporter substrate-binding protein [Desulfobulbaceae bacterium]|nr:ABC transporter substrate-binding protein [Desulfobulbaceae bacterium]MCK5340747.1 ABC transporter substrate-binding protein [Desulfobulbaceae bacterium]